MSYLRFRKTIRWLSVSIERAIKMYFFNSQIISKSKFTHELNIVTLELLLIATDNMYLRTKMLRIVL